MPGKFLVTGCTDKRFGIAAMSALEAEFFMTDDNNYVLVGIGFRAYNDDVTTMRLKYARLLENGRVNQDDTLEIRRGIRPDDGLETWFQCGNPQEVIVGLGLRMKNDDILTMHVHTRKVDPITGTLVDEYTHRTGKEPNSDLEVDGKAEQDVEHTLLRGVGVRGYHDDITTMVLYFGTLNKQ